MVTGRMLDDETGYIYIYNFHQHADEQFEQTVDSLLEQGAQRLIFDVRNDPGGSVEVLSNMLDPLLPEGTIMTLRAKDGEEVVYSSDAAALDIPMAVLVNADSISAAEFFAAALQEYGKAIVVGERPSARAIPSAPTRSRTARPCVCRTMSISHRRAKA